MYQKGYGRTVAGTIMVTAVIIIGISGETHRIYGDIRSYTGI